MRPNNRVNLPFRPVPRLRGVAPPCIPSNGGGLGARTSRNGGLSARRAGCLGRRK